MEFKAFFSGMAAVLLPALWLVRVKQLEDERHRKRHVINDSNESKMTMTSPIEKGKWISFCHLEQFA